jgi:hypothetical protein
MSITWCCGLLEGLFDNASNAGLAIFARTDLRGSVFVLQMRSSSYVGPPTDGAFVEEVVIRFCPGCGANLLSTYQAAMPLLLRDDLTIHTEL